MQRIRNAKQLPRRFFGSDSPSNRAFSLVELLVVVATTLTLAGLFMPTFVGATEKNRRATCRNHLRQFLLGVHMYANDNFARLPSGRPGSNDRRDELIPMVSTATRSCLIQYIGNARLLGCPRLPKPFGAVSGLFNQKDGCVLGYNYLGSHAGTPWVTADNCLNWISPQTANDDGAVPLITDINDWSPVYGKAFAAHSNHGPVIKEDDSGTRSPGVSSKDIGAAGGNIGLLDGSVSWKNSRQMQTYSGSRLCNNGCFAAW